MSLMIVMLLVCFLYRDSSIARLLDMRRRFIAVLCNLDAMLRWGDSLARSVELASQWDKVFAIGPSCPIAHCDLAAVQGLGIGGFMRLFLLFTGVFVILSMLLLFIVVMMLFGVGGIWFGRILQFILTGGFVLIWFPRLPSFSVSLILLQMVLV